MASRVLSSSAAMGVEKHTKDLLTGERFETTMQYHNPFAGAQLVHRQLVYPAAGRRKGSKPPRRLVPGLNPDAPTEKELAVMRLEAERAAAHAAEAAGPRPDFGVVRSFGSDYLDPLAVYGTGNEHCNGGVATHAMVPRLSSQWPTQLANPYDDD